ncbi:hypothetical protein ACFC26_23860 [Kitasatospora purpeofusca]|uniref:hypothetical protein n=1 Tax=Kitasatospora purpeofusca TaxID=67352 RepID=UPI0035D8E94C
MQNTQARVSRTSSRSRAPSQHSCEQKNHGRCAGVWNSLRQTLQLWMSRLFAAAPRLRQTGEQ